MTGARLFYHFRSEDVKVQTVLRAGCGQLVRIVLVVLDANWRVACGVVSALPWHSGVRNLQLILRQLTA